mmetsp:Transcript_6755/g.8818  ORF Transcript_6755/g.8818 Transcript_6755/m.8818 type:complete len:95 (+) Transcript_6755:156-440(+)
MMEGIASSSRQVPQQNECQLLGSYLLSTKGEVCMYIWNSTSYHYTIIYGLYGVSHKSFISELMQKSKINGNIYVHNKTSTPFWLVIMPNNSIQK